MSSGNHSLNHYPRRVKQVLGSTCDHLVCIGLKRGCIIKSSALGAPPSAVDQTVHSTLPRMSGALNTYTMSSMDHTMDAQNRRVLQFNVLI